MGNEQTQKKPYNSPMVVEVTFEGDVICSSRHDVFTETKDNWSWSWYDGSNIDQ